MTDRTSRATQRRAEHGTLGQLGSSNAAPNIFGTNPLPHAQPPTQHYLRGPYKSPEDKAAASFLASCTLSELPTNTLSLRQRHDVLYRLLELLPTQYLSRIPQEQRIPEPLIALIIREARAIIAAEPIVVEINSPVYICGDLHGQYYDLVNVFLRCPPLGGGVFGPAGLASSAAPPAPGGVKEEKDRGSSSSGVRTETATGDASNVKNGQENGNSSSKKVKREADSVKKEARTSRSASTSSSFSFTTSTSSSGSDDDESDISSSTLSSSSSSSSFDSDSSSATSTSSSRSSSASSSASESSTEARAKDDTKRTVKKEEPEKRKRSRSEALKERHRAQRAAAEKRRREQDRLRRQQREERREERAARKKQRKEERRRKKHAMYNFLFLGDYVDRGTRSIEVLVTLLSLKIISPQHMFLLRGNHEDEQIMYLYGFFDECKRRYGTRLFKIFADLFRMLPVAAIVNGSMFCMHGGLSPDLQRISAIPDVRPSNVPHSGVICDLLWSDPEHLPPGTLWGPSSRRISYVFSEEALAQFLRDNDLDLVVRAHQVVEEGYLFFPNNKNRMLLTIFTASNYCNEFGNRGAVLCVDGTGVCRLLTLEPPNFSQQRDIMVLREATPNTARGPLD